MSTSSKETTVVLAGGGTAGHVNPLLATADQLRNKGVTPHIIGTKEGLEKDLVPKAGYELHTIERVPFPRRPGLYMFRFPVAFKASIRHAGQILDRVKPAVVVGFGGYVSTPVYLAAKKRSIPVVIHEQNARPGLANKLGARWARDVALTFASTPLKAAKGHTHHIGLPLRKAIYDLAMTKDDDYQQLRRRCATIWDLDPARPVLMVTGGSLGAQQLNDAFCQAMPQLPADIQVIHLTGKGKDAPVKKALDKAGLHHYRIRDYLVTMEDALGIADLVICRSGAGTVSEMSALGIPAVYVPLAIGNGEQKLNAADVVHAGGALLIDNKDFTSDSIFSTVLPLLNDQHRLEQMSRAARSVGQVDAAARLADLILRRKAQ